MNIQALGTQFERDIQSKEEQAEEKRRGLVKNLRDLETELEEGHRINSRDEQNGRRRAEAGEEAASTDKG